MIESGGNSGEVIRDLARQRESQVREGHLCSDHFHAYIAIPPKYAIIQVVGYSKGKSAIHLARTFGKRTRNFTGENFGTRGDFASTIKAPALPAGGNPE